MQSHKEDYKNQLIYTHKQIRKCCRFLSKLDEQEILDSCDSGYEQGWLESISILMEQCLFRAALLKD